MVKIRGLTTLVMLSAVLISSAASAAESSFGWAKQEIALSLGYGMTLPVAGQIENLGYLQASPRWGIGISNPLGDDSWYRGNFELLIEGLYLHEFRPEKGDAGGSTLGIRYNFLSGEKFVPFFEIGGGILGLNFNVKRQRDGFSELGYGGIGAHYFLTNRMALTAHWRFQHISNGGNERNIGINSGVALFGLAYFFN
jgi:lipid A 3-O-deacylase